MIKKTISTLLAILITLSCLSMSAFAGNAGIKPDKQIYTPLEKMEITVSGISSDEAAVYLYKEGARVDQWESFEWVNSLEGDTWKVKAPTAVGNWEIRLYGQNSEEYPNSLLATVPIQVLYATSEVKILPDKELYTLGEAMKVTLSGVTDAQRENGSQIVIFKKGARINQWETFEWVSSLDSSDTWQVNAPNEAGEYELHFYGCSDIETYPDSLIATVPFTVGYTNVTTKLTLNKSSYALEEPMLIQAQGLTDAQIKANAQIVLYPVGARVDQWITFESISDLGTNNTWKVKAPDQAGSYEARLYGADPTTDPNSLLNCVQFMVGGQYTPSIPTVDNPLVAGQNGASDWAVSEINSAIKENLTTDKVMLEFARSITREEFCELAVKLYENISGKTATPAPTSTFSDTQNPEILKAYQLGIITGTGNGKFAPLNSVTRQEIATMLLRTVKAAIPQLDTTITSPEFFVDASEIDSWAIEGVNYFSAKEIIKGANGAFMPKANCTCEAAIALIKRTFDSFSAI